MYAIDSGGAIVVWAPLAGCALVGGLLMTYAQERYTPSPQLHPLASATPLSLLMTYAQERYTP